ncbi:MAG: L-serine ammonia-lyase, iron-sulfur-dependent, subunit alpha [Veillonellaceae bacterium]|nr:L-serine ammonia-lyase, iron-sulfur-dependent, subunit alpha [Veillonellaceae bacterium]
MDKLSLLTWLEDATAENISFGQYCLQTQAAELEIEEAALLQRMQESLSVMRNAIDFGLTGVRSTGGLVGGSGLRLKTWHEGADPRKQLLGTLVAKAATYALAANEANAAMGRICAAPTAGSSGVLPGIFFAIAEECAIAEDRLALALVTAGSIGMVLASRASLSGAEGGCQAECGSAAAMAAGAAVDLLGGSPDQIGHAVALALKNLLGLVCDPVAGLVEVPCVKRNAGAAMIALLAADMALAGIESAIPVDEVIDAMAEIGHALPETLRETGRGGLAGTPTGRAYTERFFGSRNHLAE